MKTNTDVHC